MFEWDDDKDASDIAKHGVSFELASRIFAGVVWTIADHRADYGEARKISVGVVDGIAFLTVVHTDRSRRIRIISARPASRRERARYEQETRSADDRRGDREGDG